MIKDIRHTGIVVDNLEKSLWFYKEKLGFEVFKEMEESGNFIDRILGIQNLKVTTIKMKLENSQMIELLDFSSHKKNNTKKSVNDIGPTHLAFTVVNLDKIYLNFLKDGVKFISKPVISDDGGVKVAFCKAPEGTYIELVEVLSESLVEK
jgi:catechol 2,3-dioxygenase-like lactoylglutathione lyase family enzyme